MKDTVLSLDHLVLSVTDMEQTIAFYRDVLGMGVESFEATDGTTRTALTFGSQKINLHLAAAPYVPHAARPTVGSADLCFLVSGDLGDWVSHIAAMGSALEEGPVRRTGATGPIDSLYLRDPDGALIELSVPGGPLT